MSKSDVRHEPLLASRFRFSGPQLLFARARLFADRIELSGWHLRGRYRREVALRRILQADVSREGDLLLWLSNGKTLRLRVRLPQRWKAMIEARAQAERLRLEQVHTGSLKKSRLG